MLALAGLTLVTPEMSDEGGGAAVLIGIGVGTLLAHIFADLIGEEVRERRKLTNAERREILRDLLPVLTGMLPAGRAPRARDPAVGLGTVDAGARRSPITLLRLPLVAVIVAARTGRHPLVAVRRERPRDRHRRHQGARLALTTDARSARWALPSAVVFRDSSALLVHALHQAGHLVRSPWSRPR